MSVSDPSKHVRFVMATRRDDSRAKVSWSGVLSALEANENAEAVIYDRTRDGSAMEFYRSALRSVDFRDRLHLVRQDHKSPTGDVWRHLVMLEPRWLTHLHDDDSWTGCHSVPDAISEDVSVVIPNLDHVSNGRLAVAPAMTTQHALFGLVRPDIATCFLRYLADSPTPNGGSDMLLMRLCTSAGTSITSPSYSYLWDTGNWASHTWANSIQSYLDDAGWGDVSQGDIYVLLQQLDILAVMGRARPLIAGAHWNREIERLMRHFWPFTAEGARAILKVAPTKVRYSVVASRGAPQGLRLRSTFLRLMEPLPRYDSQFEEIRMGMRVLEGIQEVIDDLLPALTHFAPTSFRAQVDFLRGEIRETHRLYAANQKTQGEPSRADSLQSRIRRY